MFENWSDSDKASMATVVAAEAMSIPIMSYYGSKFFADKEKSASLSSEVGNLERTDRVDVKKIDSFYRLNKEADRLSQSFTSAELSPKESRTKAIMTVLNQTNSDVSVRRDAQVAFYRNIQPLNSSALDAIILRESQVAFVRNALMNDPDNVLGRTISERFSVLRTASMEHFEARQFLRGDLNPKTPGIIARAYTEAMTGDHLDVILRLGVTREIRSLEQQHGLSSSGLKDVIRNYYGLEESASVLRNPIREIGTNLQKLTESSSRRQGAIAGAILGTIVAGIGTGVIYAGIDSHNNKKR